MKKMLLLALIVALCIPVCSSQAWAKDKADPWEELWERYEAGEIQFAIAVSEKQIAEKDIPVDWTREMIVDWLEKAWLVIEKGGAQLEEDEEKPCHLIVRDYHQLCVPGGGPKRCCCRHDVQY